LFMVSSMLIHSAPCNELIRDACRIDSTDRPLIIVGGPKVIYEPWDVFNIDTQLCASADVAITGEEYVLLQLLEVLLSIRASGESMRSAFKRARDMGALDDIPGLIYARGTQEDRAEELVDTGIQRLVGNLDELPHPTLGYGLLERPSRSATLAHQAIGPSEVRKYTPVVSQVMTFGCKFSCGYCPIPTYNQKQHRVKSGRQLADEMTELYKTYGLRYYFGTDDNFFNDRTRTMDIVETFNRLEFDGERFGHKMRWATEATVHGTLKMKDDLRQIHRAGMYALWLGVEDMSGALVRKGQSEDQTLEAFRTLRKNGIGPMPMLMHHDNQPLWTRGNSAGLLNQVRLLRKVGAVSVQVLMIIPSPGSRLFEEAFTSGSLYHRVGTRPVEPYMLDGNYVVASNVKRPWVKQLNLLVTYLYFYNPLRFLLALVRPKSTMYLVDPGMMAIGMYGLAQTIRRTFGWAMRLMFCKIKRRSEVPFSPIPMRTPDGNTASHALPGTVLAEPQIPELPVCKP
ncbi:B12-binding domain-containing radical SAM protein, partial [Planctomycetota bacterium]